MEKNRESFLKYGIPDDIIEKLLKENYTVSKVRTASIKDIEKFLSSDDAKTAKRKVQRQAIPDDVFKRLVKETELHCCFCWDIKTETPIIIHHIDEYNKTQDNSFNNLIVLCLNHHGEVHTKRAISNQNFPRIRQLDQKEKWINALSEYRDGKRSAPGSETKNDGINVINSPGTIVADSVTINQNAYLQRKLIYFEGDTQPQIDQNTGKFKTLYVFGSQQGVAFSHVSVSIKFDKAFDSAKGYIAGNGMVAAGKLDRRIHNNNMGYDFITNFLNPNNYLVIETESDSQLAITSLVMQP